MSNLVNQLYGIIFFLCAGFTFAQEKTEFYRWNADKNDYEFDFFSTDKLNDLDSLAQNGFYTLQIDSIINNRIYVKKGRNYQKIWVKSYDLFQNQDFYPTNNLDSLISKSLEKYIAKGYVFSSVNILPLGNQDDIQKVELKLNLGELRKIDAVKSVGYPKLSKGFIQHGLGLKVGKIYKEEDLNHASAILQNTAYLQQIKEPQTLFRPDSTILYIYPKKVKSNSFDGILGFGTDEQGSFKLNGNLILELNNVFNNLEQIRLNWIATANKNITLDAQVKLPYLFKTKLGTQTNINIFKQDSVFVNLQLNQRLFYQINPQSNIGLTVSYGSSNYLLDEHENASDYDDYSKFGVGLMYEHFVRNPIPILEGQSLLKLYGTTLTRTENNFSWQEEFVNEKAKQIEIGLETYRIFKLLDKHYLKGSLLFRGLFDENKVFSENELYRIGGFGSIRGFNEESILANLYAVASAEYRFLPSNDIYINLFSDYGLVENKRQNLNTSFLSIGTGLSFMTKIGIFNISYAMGKTNQIPFNFKESKIHFGILSKF